MLSPLLSPYFQILDFLGLSEINRIFRKYLKNQCIMILDNSGQNQQKRPVKITKALLYQLS